MVLAPESVLVRELPGQAIRVPGLIERSATALSGRHSDQSGVAAILVVINFVAIELPFKIALVPKQSLIEMFAPDGSKGSVATLKTMTEECPRGTGRPGLRPPD